MKEPGIKRSESLNGDPKFIEALADIAKQHLESGDRCSRQMPLRCPMCVSVRCQEQKVSSNPHVDRNWKRTGILIVDTEILLDTQGE